SCRGSCTLACRARSDEDERTGGEKKGVRFMYVCMGHKFPTFLSRSVCLVRGSPRPQPLTETKARNILPVISSNKVHTPRQMQQILRLRQRTKQTTNAHLEPHSTVASTPPTRSYTRPL
ncbi:unnamed protein product, partial [Ectocarpus sp. 12 AP-2014]